MERSRACKLIYWSNHKNFGDELSPYLVKKITGKDFEAAKQIVHPDFVFLITCPAELAVQRIKSRSEECDRYLDEDFLRGVRQEFLRLGKGYGFWTITTDRQPSAAFTDIKKILEMF